MKFSNERSHKNDQPYSENTSYFSRAVHTVYYQKTLVEWQVDEEQMLTNESLLGFVHVFFLIKRLSEEHLFKKNFKKFLMILLSEVCWRNHRYKRLYTWFFWLCKKKRQVVVLTLGTEKGLAMFKTVASEENHFLIAVKLENNVFLRQKYRGAAHKECSRSCENERFYKFLFILFRNDNQFKCKM